MNLKRGFRRIIFVLSLLASLTSAVLCFFAVLDTWDSERVAYDNSINDHENIVAFWRIWDQDGWVAGKKEIVGELLDNGWVRFNVDDNKVACLYTNKVFPGIDKNMLQISLNSLDKYAQTAKKQAIESAKQRVKSHEYWGTKNTIAAIIICIVAAFGVAGLGFLITWIIGVAIYKFFEWLILGFRDETHNQIEKAKPSH